MEENKKNFWHLLKSFSQTLIFKINRDDSLESIFWVSEFSHYISTGGNYKPLGRSRISESFQWKYKHLGWLSESLQCNYKPLGWLSESFQWKYKPLGWLSESLQWNYKPPLKDIWIPPVELQTPGKDIWIPAVEL